MHIFRTFEYLVRMSIIARVRVRVGLRVSAFSGLMGSCQWYA